MAKIQPSSENSVKDLENKVRYGDSKEKEIAKAMIKIKHLKWFRVSIIISIASFIISIIALFKNNF